MAGHMSVVVRTPEATYFLAGDATYDEELLKQRIVDGSSENIGVSCPGFGQQHPGERDALLLAGLVGIGHHRPQVAEGNVGQR